MAARRVVAGWAAGAIAARGTTGQRCAAAAAAAGASLSPSPWRAVAAAASSAAAAAKVEWSHDEKQPNGPSKWGKLRDANGELAYPSANEKMSWGKQSPVNINTAEAKEGKADELKWKASWAAVTNSVVLNTNHDIKWRPDEDQVQEKNLVLQYKGVEWALKEVHVHVSAGQGKKGSEHVFSDRDKKAEGEIHIVHYQKKYGSYEEATQHEDGLAVLGVLIQEVPDGSADKTSIFFKGLENFPLPEGNAHGASGDDASKSLRHIQFDVSTLLPSSENIESYHYKGSLTTPGCENCVEWIVVGTPLKMRTKDLAVLRGALDGDKLPIVDNFRPPQDLGTRSIFKGAGSVQK